MAENTEAKVYSEKQCSHGRCLNHSPKWKEVEPGNKMKAHIRPLGYLDKLTNLYRKIRGFAIFYRIETVGQFGSDNCCDRPLLRCDYASQQRCELCGREDFRVGRAVQYCRCCGYAKFYIPGEWRGAPPSTLVEAPTMSLDGSRLMFK